MYTVVEDQTNRYDAYNDSGNSVSGWVTVEIEDFNTKKMFDEHVRTLVKDEVKKVLQASSDTLFDDEFIKIVLSRTQIFMTTEACWSGYSEYTITNEWSEIILTIPSQGLEFRYESVPKFFAALAEATKHLEIEEWRR